MISPSAQIFDPDGEPIVIEGLSDLDGVFMPDDDSFLFNELMGDDYVELVFSEVFFKDIPIGSYCYPKDSTTKYTSFTKPQVTVINSANFKITVRFYAPYYSMHLYKMLDVTEHRESSTKLYDGTFKSSFFLTGSPRLHLDKIIANLNYRNAGGQTWSVYGVPDDVEKTIQYDNVSIFDAFKNICEEFQLEYTMSYISSNIITIKEPWNGQKTTALPLAYGKGNGLLSGVTRSQPEENKIVKTLYVTGGTKNILNKLWAGESIGNYDSSRLKLPADQVYLWYDGEDFYDSLPANAPYYCIPFQVSEDRNAVICRKSGLPVFTYEDAVTIEDAYPSHVCTVSDVYLYSEGTGDYQQGPLWWIRIDSELDEGLLDYLTDPTTWMPDSSLNVSFRDGELIGKSFVVSHVITESEAQMTFDEDSTRNNGVGEGGYWLELSPIQDDQLSTWVPQSTSTSCFIPRVGTHFIIDNIKLPTSYIEEAEVKLFQLAIKELYPKCQEVYTIDAEVDPVWLSDNWDSVRLGTKLSPGKFISFSDPSMQASSVLMRILTETTNFNNRKKVNVSFSSTVIKNASVKRLVNRALAQQVQITHIDQTVSNVINNIQEGRTVCWDYN